MEKLKTATGKEFDCAYVSVLPDLNRCYVVVSNADIATVASVFSDPAETATLTHGETVVGDYTKLLAILPEEGDIRINLRKE